MLLIEIKCKKLELLFNNNSKIELISIKNIEKNIFKAVSNNNDTLYFYFKNGTTVFHNYKEEPAILLNNGTKIFMENNKIHRDNDEPAVIFENNFEMYLMHGKFHRINDKPAIIVNWLANFPDIFYINDIFFYNENLSGFSIWFYNDKIHRLHNPAFVHNIDPEYSKYFINDEEYSELNFKKICLQHLLESF